MADIQPPNPGALRWEDLRCAWKTIDTVRREAPREGRNSLLQGALHMLNAKVGVVMQATRHPQDGLTLHVVASEGWITPTEQGIFADDAAHHRYRANPFLQRIAQSNAGGELAAFSRHQLVEDTDWYSSEYVQDTYKALDIDDVLLSLTPLSGGRGWGAVAVLRQWNDHRRFDERDRAMLTLLTDCARPIFESPRDSLSPRLREVHLLLLKGLSEKEVAARLDLSAHTIHRHVNRLYQVLGVNSRAELLTRGLSGD